MSTSRGHDAGAGARETGERRRSRERALELCYESEAKGVPLPDLLHELPIAPEDYALRLVSGVGREGESIDALIASHASGWAIDRMPSVDRGILRLAVYELMCETDVPVAVVIDEAVELAKEYSTEDSGRYVNGVLAAVAAELRPAESAPPGRVARSE